MNEFKLLNVAECTTHLLVVQSIFILVKMFNKRTLKGHVSNFMNNKSLICNLLSVHKTAVVSNNSAMCPLCFQFELILYNFPLFHVTTCRNYKV